MYLFYLGYKYYLLAIKVPSLNTMLKIIRKEETKRGVHIDDAPDNIFAEPLGVDLFAVRLVNDGVTYILSRNVLVGKSIKEISELQHDNERLTIQKILAQKGVTEMIEE